jgi:methionyl-tRNA synthetase C-terminal region/beta chain
VAIFGNFVNRAVVLTHKYFGGVVPEAGELADIDREALAQIPGIRQAIENNIENFKFREALKEAMNLARLGNKYLTDTEPWAVAKSDLVRTAAILNTSLQICANLAIAFAPFLPFSVEKLNRILNVEPFGWDDLGQASLIKAGHQLGKAELLFSKIEDEEIQKQLDRLKAVKEANAAAAAAAEAAAAATRVAPAKEECTFDDFGKMDIRTATVLAAERVPKTDKLLKLSIDTGLDQRTIVSGIAEFYTPEEMVGKQICILANLKPRTIRGIESKGMILMAKQEDGKMRIVTPEERLNNGACIG